MSITASQVKELRERTGAGMMECKKALVASEGDIELAIDNMRKSGTAKAAKKAGRTAGEGSIVIETSADNKQALILEINCETDFVARDESFLHLAETIAKRALETKTEDKQALLALSLENGGTETIEAATNALIVKLGENISVRRLQLLASAEGVVANYIHQGGRIGVVVALNTEDETLAKDIAMHIAATNPQVISPADVPQQLVDKEKEIFTAQALESGKPAEVVEKMIGGRIKKFLNEVSVLGQPFVKDPSMTVEALLKQTGAQISAFTRFEAGEGIEKKEDNFAEEVMAQVKASQA